MALAVSILAALCLGAVPFVLVVLRAGKKGAEPQSVPFEEWKIRTS